MICYNERRGRALRTCSREKPKFVYKHHSLSTLFHISKKRATIISTLSRMYFLESLFLLGQGTILFSSRKKYLILVFITNIRRPHFLKTEKNLFFISLYLQIRSFTPSLNNIFSLKLRPSVSGFAPFSNRSVK